MHEISGGNYRETSESMSQSRRGLLQPGMSTETARRGSSTIASWLCWMILSSD
jgi:hypothetical protein